LTHEFYPIAEPSSNVDEFAGVKGGAIPYASLIKALMNSPNLVKWKFLVRELKKEGLSDES